MGWWNWYMLIVPVPAALGYGASAVCKMPPSDDIPFRPPAWAFAVVWPVLYVLLGLAWYRTARRQGLFSPASVAYALLNALLVGWLVIYSCARRTREAVFTLLAAVLATAYCVALSDDGARLMLLPLLVWGSFATLMNAWQTAAK